MFTTSRENTHKTSKIYSKRSATGAESALTYTEVAVVADTGKTCQCNIHYKMSIKLGDEEEKRFM